MKTIKSTVQGEVAASKAGALTPSRAWLVYALVTTGLWGIWGALIELPERAGFPPTLGYAAWALTMVPCALIVLGRVGFGIEHDARSIGFGMAVGLTGAGGQLVLFQALRLGPAFIVFPLVSLYPVVAVVLSFLVLRERAPRHHIFGILLALPGIALLSYEPPGEASVSGYGWLLLASGTFLAWGVQAVLMKLAQDESRARAMRAESLFFYMTLAGVLLIPVAVLMTDFAQPINWGGSGAVAALGIQVLNALGALALVYAMRFGKAIVVAPMTALAPVITIVLSLVLHERWPAPANAVGMVCALVAIFLLSK